MIGYCSYFKCDCDEYEEIEKRQNEMGEMCFVDCLDCEWYEK